MENYGPISFLLILGLISACILLPLIIYSHLDLRKEIHRELKNYGVTPVSIRRVWLDSDENTATFQVTYLNRHKMNYKTTCKIFTSGGYDNRFYWKEPIFRDNDVATPKVEIMQEAAIETLQNDNSVLRKEIKSLRSHPEVDQLRKENAILKARIKVLERQIQGNK